MTYNSKNLSTQNNLLFENLMLFFKQGDNLQKMSNIINGNSYLSLRIIDWFVTNYSKKYDINYKPTTTISKYNKSFRVYNEYKLKLKAYGKIKFDPFCRWTRITIPFDEEHYMETTIGQLNFFKWALENEILEYILDNYDKIETDMNMRNSTSRKKTLTNIDNSINMIEKEKYIKKNTNEQNIGGGTTGKTRKKREELSVSSCKCMKTENINITLHF